MTTLACQDVQAEISNYLDEDISPDIRQALEAHLATCQTCQVLIDSMRKTLRIVSGHGTVELPVDTSSRLVERIMARVRAEDSKS